MADWLIDLIGISRKGLPEGAPVRLEWAGLPHGEKLLFLLLFGLLLVGLTAWLYRREGAASGLQKALLALLRVSVIIATLLVFCQPRLVADKEKTIDSVTLMLIDNSLSMSIQDRIDSQDLRKQLSLLSGIKDYDLQSHSRAKILSAILNNKDIDLINRLAKTNTVEIFTFGKSTKKLERVDGELKIVPKGQYTDLSAGIRYAMEMVPGKNIASVIVFSDGRANAGEYPSAVASFLKDRSIPIYTVGIGNPDPPRNIEVVELLANPRVYKNDPVVFYGRVKATGFHDVKVKATLERVKTGSDQSELVAEQDIEIKGSRFEEKLVFQVTPTESGEFLYSLKIEPQEDELTSADNAVSRVLRVIEDDTRVLLIAGAPTSEYRLLRNLLMRERTIQVSCWLQSADRDFPQDGNKRIDKLPRTQEGLFKYDVVVMIDPRDDMLDRPWAELVERFVGRHGGGLCYVAGDKNTTALFSNDTLAPLRDVFPVKGDTSTADSINMPGRRHTDRWSMKLTPEGQDHAITRLSRNSELLKEFWARLPGFYWHYPVESKAGASVLLESTDPTRINKGRKGVLLAAHFYGPGRTVFASFDSSWRWRTRAVSSYQRYWIQLMRYLVEGRLLGGQRRMNLKTDKDGYELGDMMTVRVKMLTKGFQPMTGARLTGLAQTKSGFKEEIRLEEQKKDGEGTGVYIGTFVPEAPELYEISAEATSLISGGGKISKTVRVSLPNVEFSDPSLNSALLKDIAQTTGGKLVDLDKLKELPDWIPSKREKTPIQGWVAPLWDNAWTLALLVLLLSLEWFFRKRCRMV
jgi:hypothetical protein